MITLEQIKRYYELNELQKDIKKELDSIKKEIKDFMIKSETSSIKTDEYSVTLTSAKTKSVKEDELASYLLSKEYNECVDVKYVPSMEKVETLLALGIINRDLYENEFLDVKETIRINIKHN